MNLKNFKTYNLAREYYLGCSKLELKGAIRDQLSRASLSIVLNIAEATGKPTMKDQRKFFGTALGSLRDSKAMYGRRACNPEGAASWMRAAVQAILDLIEHRE